MRRTVLPLILFLVLFAACATPRAAHPDITVEGRVSVRGNEPFTGIWLETDVRTFYILVMDQETRSALVNPAMYRVTGQVYRDDWNGRPYAHLAVSDLVRLDR